MRFGAVDSQMGVPGRAASSRGEKLAGRPGMVWTRTLRARAWHRARSHAARALVLLAERDGYRVTRLDDACFGNAGVEHSSRPRLRCSHQRGFRRRPCASSTKSVARRKNHPAERGPFHLAYGARSAFGSRRSRAVESLCGSPSSKGPGGPCSPGERLSWRGPQRSGTPLPFATEALATRAPEAFRPWARRSARAGVR